MNLARVLASIGKANFINFYEDYKEYYLSNNKAVMREKLAEKLLRENSKAYDISGQYTRINCARRIFENKVEKETLEIILESRVSSEVKDKATRLLEAI